MISVDISNVWGQVSLRDLLALEKETLAAHCKLTDGSGEGGEALGWRDLPRRMADEAPRIADAARRIRESSEVFVVVGIGGSYLGPRAAIELMYGPNYNLKRGTLGSPRILFAGNTLSTRAWNDLLEQLDGKEFSVVFISKSGTTMEPAIATRALRWMTERKYGTEGAKARLFAITDPLNGALRQMASDEGWETFSIAPDVGGRFSVLSPVGLLPMAVAGIDIEALLAGAAQAREDLEDRSFENPAWLYAAIRNLMYRRGKEIELLASFEPAFDTFGMWWQQLFGESEGKDEEGLFPVAAQYTADLHSLGQMVQQGKRNLFETMVRFSPPEIPVTVGPDVKNLDALSYLEGKSLDYIEEQAFRGTVNAHVDGGVPVVTIDLGELTDRSLGEIFYFFELSCGLSAYILGVNPFNQPGVEFYKQNMFRLLGKPGFEK